MANNLRKLKWITWLTFASVLLFCIFFSTSKHQQFLSRINVFIEDPFDAIGSFGVMLAIFAGLLGVIRLYRPHPDEQLTISAAASILRCNLSALTAILVTLTTDILALIRFTNRWIGSPAGWILTGLTSGLLILAAILFIRCLRFGKELISIPGRKNISPILISLASAIILFLYPERWRLLIAGALLTALIGMVILFAVSASIVRSIYPHPDKSSNDILDDIRAIYEWLERRSKLLRNVSRSAGRLVKLPWISKIIAWFNPRRHPWRLAISFAFIIGLALFIVELIGEGAPQLSKFTLVFGVFVGIGTAGVITGYVLLNRYLDIFRVENQD